MQIAGLKPLLAYLNDETGTYGSDDLLAHIWKAMLAASPTRDGAEWLALNEVAAERAEHESRV